MAMTKCPECGSQISTSAAVCPSCGAKPDKPTSRLTIAIAGLFAIGLAAAISRHSDNETERPAPAAKTPAELAETARKDREINTVLAGARMLKQSMKKPETFELTRATMIDGKVICYEYVARNSFNDQAPGHYVVSDAVSSNSIKAWNALCAGKSGDDYTSVRAVM